MVAVAANSIVSVGTVEAVALLDVVKIATAVVTVAVVVVLDICFRVVFIAVVVVIVVIVVKEAVT